MGGRLIRLGGFEVDGWEVRRVVVRKGNDWELAGQVNG